MYLNKKESGIAAWIIVVVVAIALIGGGIALYQSGRNSAYDDISFEGIEISEGQSEEVLSANDCVTNINIQPGQLVSFPLQVTGDLGYGCWGIFEGEAGFAFIRQNNQVVSASEIPDGLIQVNGSYYQEGSYPVVWSSTITELIGGVSGPAELVIQERGDLGEESGQYVPQEVVIPINIDVTTSNNNNPGTPELTGTTTIMVPLIDEDGGIQMADNAGIPYTNVPQSWRDQGLWVGCGVSIVWVPVVVEETQAVLNATYEYLFAANPTIIHQGEMYSNLIGSYAQNADYPMNYESVEINGTTARIYLTGTIMNNHCADPAIMAQLSFAATQYPTVDSFEIYLNGQPFDTQAWYNSYQG